jgi:hypothetical protein
MSAGGLLPLPLPLPLPLLLPIAGGLACWMTNN